MNTLVIFAFLFAAANAGYLRGYSDLGYGYGDRALVHGGRTIIAGPSGTIDAAPGIISRGYSASPIVHAAPAIRATPLLHSAPAIRTTPLLSAVPAIRTTSLLPAVPAIRETSLLPAVPAIRTAPYFPTTPYLSREIAAPAALLPATPYARSISLDHSTRIIPATSYATAPLSSRLIAPTDSLISRGIPSYW